jgi:ABC-2 type transport system permease protein
MIFTIANHEFRSMLRDRRFLLAAALLSLLFVLSLLGAYQYHVSLQNQHAHATQTARQQWETQKDKNPHSAAHYGTYAFKPVSPLTFFDRGLDAYTGNTLFLEAHKMNEAQHRTVADRHDFARLGNLTPAFVLSILFPLFIIVLGFGTVAGEREEGNLRLLMAQGLRPRDLFLGKSIGLWYAVLLLAVPFFALGAVGLFLPGARAEDWSRYLLTGLVYLLYLGCFVHLTLLISAWARGRNVALVASLGVWIFICLIVPKAAVNLARWQHPTPSWQSYRDGIEEDLEKGVDGHDPSDAYTEKLEKETLKQYGVDSVQHLPFNWWGFMMQKGEEHETFVFQKNKDKLLGIYDRQQKIHEAASVLSPYLLTNIASQRLAATDVATYFHFLAAAERYRIQLVGELNGDLTKNFKYDDWDTKRGKAFFASNARFDYQPLAFSEVQKNVGSALLMLALWWLASGLLGLWAFRHLKVLG